MKSVVIIARDLSNGIARGGEIPWFSPAHMETWRRITSDGQVVAGSVAASVLGCTSIASWTPDLESTTPVYIAGGKKTILKWMSMYRVDTIVECRILGRYNCDLSLTDDDLQLHSYATWAIRDMPGCRWTVWTTRHGTDGYHIPRACLGWHVESPYLDLVRRVLDHGKNRPDRTGTGTRSIFGHQLEFNLQNGFPLLTTKKVFWRGIVSELIWFLQGQTDATVLSQKGVRIWDANTSREALDRRGLATYRDGDAGPVYGFQWRHWGASYNGPKSDSTQYGGHDQLATLIRQLRDDPYSRRHIVSAWNVEDLDTMALPPCHLLFQCYVNGDQTLDMHVYQRSVDIGLGLPFNIASYSLLNHLICYVTGYVPGRLVMSLGDAHIYRDHIDDIKTQLARIPRRPPKVLIKKNTYTRLDEFIEGDIRLVGYDPAAPIRMSMSA